MDLPDLLPDIRFERLSPSEEDFRYSFEVKRAGMKPHVLKRWPWDEDAQIQRHQINFAEKPFFKILLKSDDVGTVSFMKVGEYLRFGEFYLLPAYQRLGIGTRVLVHCLEFADSIGIPVRLEYLKWNPVASLYLRHGFARIGETETHWLVQRRVATV